MSRVPLIGLLILTAPFASGQSTGSDETVRFLRQAWATVQREGPEALETAKVRWPEEIRNIRREVAEFTAKVQGSSFAGRARTLAELWRIRGSLNLLALLSPEGLKTVTGMDVPDLRALRRRVEKLRMPG